MGAIAETTATEVKHKETQYQQSRQDSQWWQDYSACNLWTAAFFMPLTEQNLQLLPTTAALTRLMQGQELGTRPLNPPAPSNLLQFWGKPNVSPQSWGDCRGAGDFQSVPPRIGGLGGQSSFNYVSSEGNSTQKVVEAANQLAQEKRFFHWAIEFPEVFEQGGFDCVLGNPPWERIKLQEEVFASRNSKVASEIANAANKAARQKLIEKLPQTNPQLAQAWEEAQHDANAQGKFVRESNRYPLTAFGDINTYAVFAETTRNLVSASGRVGAIVPTGIATDNTCKNFFGDLIQQQDLASLYDFENREAIFPAVHRSYKFSLLTVSGKPIEQTQFSFFLTQPRQLGNGDRVFQLAPKDIALLNPNTFTCPVFRTRADAELTKKIYQRVF